ncbi:CidA/LrgA family protein [Polluticaenibacter yanchengensis]|uniref:CidA/LrgA family protein n=1 Tax=Polluticaenibacter yanchengensis TaxID=3014562 RepID=A0ABT4ULJ8_9BACT|nr:CidA/LrgA family protein [Chitinophagaceae bacterium LY-5]
MNSIKQLAIIFGCLAFGELIVYLTHVKIPASIIGMLTLWGLLQLKIIRLKDVEGLSAFLIKNMGIFFVPPCVAMINYFGIMSKSLVPILVATLASTILVVFVTGITHQFLRNRQ